jgi:hypothetical protein
MTTATEISPGLLPAGLFLLKLQSETHLEGAPLLGLTLTVYTPKKTVTGYAEVTQALAQPVVCQSHVHGDLTYETVMSPGKSAVRIDLSGHLAVNWPAIDGIGPVLPENFKATLVLSTDYTEGAVVYEYLTDLATGTWNCIEQKIKKVS